MSREVDYRKAAPQAFYVTVKALRGRKFEPVEACPDGIVVRHNGARETGSVARWPAVVLALRWALERSPDMRRDVRAMLDEIERQPEVSDVG